MKRMSSDPAMRDAAFEHNRRMMDMAQLRYEGKREGLAEGIEKGIEQGIGQGIEKQRLETAKEMLRNHCNDQLIQLCTKISLQQLEQLKKEVYEANMLLPKYGLVTFTWGNVSGIDRESGLFVIKPSGVEYDKLTPDDMVVVDLNGNKVEGRYNPSSDTPTHVVLYNRFPKIGGVVHTHSTWATSWAQAGRDIPCYGTTHADYIYGEIPCVRNLTKEEIEEAYEKNTGVLIADEFEAKKKDYIAVPAVLCKNHGVFTWGKDAHEAVHNAVVAEEVAKMAARCEMINPQVKPAPQELQDKHYYRKHGANAYYGQNTEK